MKNKLKIMTTVHRGHLENYSNSIRVWAESKGIKYIELPQQIRDCVIVYQAMNFLIKN